jgi:alpha(1,3/1,4) fucosyltransferase
MLKRGNKGRGSMKFLNLFLGMCLYHSLVYSSAKIIYIIPDSPKNASQLFNLSIPTGKPRHVKQNFLSRMRYLKEKCEKMGYIVKVAASNEYDNIPNLSRVKYIIDLTDNCTFSLRYKERYHNKLVVFLWEPPSVKPHLYNKAFHRHLAKIFVVDDNLVDNNKYHKLIYPNFRSDFFIEPKPFFQKKSFVLINANKFSDHASELYSARKSVINFFERRYPNMFHYFGKGWRNSVCYRGKIPWHDKWELLSRYRFCICYENITNIKGYITEKIFDCFEAGCIPIYWGADNITDYIPKNCFIDRRDFNNFYNLFRTVSAMPESVYTTYLENIKNYLHSEEAHYFTYKNLFKNICQALLNAKA